MSRRTQIVVVIIGLVMLLVGMRFTPGAGRGPNARCLQCGERFSLDSSYEKHEARHFKMARCPKCGDINSYEFFFMFGRPSPPKPEAPGVAHCPHCGATHAEATWFEESIQGKRKCPSCGKAK